MTTNATAPIPGKSCLSSAGQGVLRIPRLSPDDNVDGISSPTRTSLSDITLEPFEGFQHYNKQNVDTNIKIPTDQDTETPSQWNLVQRNHNKRRRQAKYTNKLLLDNADIENNNTYFVKFLTVKFPGKNINTDIDVIKTDDELKSIIGEPSTIVKAGYNSIQVATKSKAQTEKLLKVTTLADNQVVVEPHRSLNVVKGVVRSSSFAQSTLTKLEERLKDQGVSNIRRISKKVGEDIIETDTFVLTFNRLTRPKVLKITDWHNVLVHEYKERPQHCYNCQRYGHVAKYCRRESTPTCAKCGIEGHSMKNCTSDFTKCINCKGSHYATSKTCPSYLLEEEILATMVKEQTSKLNARERVLARSPEYGRLYSQTATRRNATPQTPNITQTQITNSERSNERNTQQLSVHCTQAPSSQASQITQSILTPSILSESQPNIMNHLSTNSQTAQEKPIKTSEINTELPSFSQEDTSATQSKQSVKPKYSTENNIIHSITTAEIHPPPPPQHKNEANNGKSMSKPSSAVSQSDLPKPNQKHSSLSSKDESPVVEKQIETSFHKTSSGDLIEKMDYDVGTSNKRKSPTSPEKPPEKREKFKHSLQHNSSRHDKDNSSRHNKNNSSRHDKDNSSRHDKDNSSRHDKDNSKQYRIPVVGSNAKQGKR